MTVRRFAAAAVAVSAALVLSSCTAEEPETPAPKITWVNEVSPEFAEDEYVQAVVRTESARAWANQTLDFNSTELHESVRRSVAQQWQRNLENRMRDDPTPTAFVGPRPMNFISVAEPDDNGMVRVEYCTPNRAWSITEAQPEVEELFASVADDTYVRIAIMYRGDDGLIREQSSGADVTEQCDMVGAAFGVFDPIPELRASDIDAIRPVPSLDEGWGDEER